MISIEKKAGLDFRVDESLLLRAANQALQYTSAADVDITLFLSDDSQVKKLNREYRQVDSSTDVLAFPGGEFDPETGRIHLGDIAISCEKARQQARARGHTAEDELQLLVVHGTLHLLGYDHERVEEKKKMWHAQADILERLGLSRMKVEG